MTEVAHPPAARRCAICLITADLDGLLQTAGSTPSTQTVALALMLAANDFNVTLALANSDESGPRMKFGDFVALQAEWAKRRIILDYVRAHPKVGGSFDDPRIASYCVYAYLQNADFDIVLFGDTGGLGFYSLLAKHTGVFANPPLLWVAAHAPTAWMHETNSVAFHSRLPVVAAYMESRCANLADLLISPSAHLVDWMVNRGWVPPGRARVLQGLVRVDETAAVEYDDTEAQPVTEIVLFGCNEISRGAQLFCDAIDLLEGTMDLRSVRVTFLGRSARVGALHSGVYVVERAQRWRATLRVLSTFDRAETRHYLRRPGVLSVIPPNAEHSFGVVAECLQIGLLFLAADVAGTAELLAADDRDEHLFPADPAALARLLEGALRKGLRRARMSVSTTDAIAQWLQLLTSPRGGDTPAASVAAKPKRDRQSPLVSICLVRSPRPHFAAWLDGLRLQTYPRLEFVVVTEGVPNEAANLRGAETAAVTLIAGSFGSMGAARNAAARKAKGQYLLFVDETLTALHSHAVSSLVAAAERTGADILTALRDLDSVEKSLKHTREWELPVGACIELGAFENCFGEGAVLVTSSYFASTAGFADDCSGRALDWLFLAGAALDGARVELLPTQLLQMREDSQIADEPEHAVEDQRRIMNRYRAAPIETIRHVAESFLRVGHQSIQKVQRALPGMTTTARDIALRLASLEPTTVEATRLFLEYCCARRNVDLALDFALYNDMPFLPDAVMAIGRTNETAALELTRTRRLNVHHWINLTEELQVRARAFLGVRGADLRRLPDGALMHFAPAGDSIVKIACAIPPGALTVRLVVAADTQSEALVAGVICRAMARPLLTDEGLASNSSAWWSGWLPAAGPGARNELSISLPEPVAELLDLYLLVRRRDADSGAPISVTWAEISADVCLIGDITPSAIQEPIKATALPLELLKRGELLMSPDASFPLYVPGERTLLHPLPNRLVIAKISGALQPGSKGLRCAVSLEHESAHPIEFAIWARSMAEPIARDTDLMDTHGFSGWIGVDVPFVKRRITLLLTDPAAQPLDIYIATRVVGYPDTYFCHAYWHEFEILEDSGESAPN
jgi:hypothetical protein